VCRETMLGHWGACGQRARRPSARSGTTWWWHVLTGVFYLKWDLIDPSRLNVCEVCLDWQRLAGHEGLLSG
jgi:hypothetical protein